MAFFSQKKEIGKMGRGGCLPFSLFLFFWIEKLCKYRWENAWAGSAGVTATSNGIIVIKKDVNGRQAGVVMGVSVQP